jgi:hypothetical protein
MWNLQLKVCCVFFNTYILSDMYFEKVNEKVKLSLCRLWKPIGLWDIEALIFSRQSANRWLWVWQFYASIALYVSKDFWYSFLSEVKSITEPYWSWKYYIKWKNPMASVIETATFRLVAQCLNQVCYRMHRHVSTVLYYFAKEDSKSPNRNGYQSQNNITFIVGEEFAAIKSSCHIESTEYVLIVN